MAEDRVVEGWRKRAETLVSETTPPFNTLLQALPRLTLLGNAHRDATRRYALVSGQEADRRVLMEIEEKAAKRVRLMRDRYEVAQSQANNEERLMWINAMIAEAQMLIFLGKLAELYIGCGTLLKQTKVVIDAAKLKIDGAKAGVAAIESVAHGGRDGETAIALLATMLLRTRGKLETVSKSIWDLASTTRRVQSSGMRKHTWMETLQSATAVLNGLKGLIEHFAAIEQHLMNSPAAAKSIGVGLGAFRDVIDAARAFCMGFMAISGIIKSFGDRQAYIEEGKGYLGVNVQGPRFQELPWRYQDATDLVSEATDWKTATALVSYVKPRSEALLRSIQAAEALYWREMTRLHVALRDLQPQMAATEHCLDRLRAQIVDLSWAVDRRDVHSKAARGIRDALVGFHAHVLAILVQAQSILLPAEQLTPAQSR